MMHARSAQVKAARGGSAAGKPALPAPRSGSVWRSDLLDSPPAPARGKASDGGDMGCRYTPEILDMLKLTFELRKKGVIKF